MDFKTILVFVDGGKHAADTLKVAFGIAKRSKGHVIGLHVRPRFQPPAATDGTFPMDTVYKAHEKTVKADAARAAATFKKAATGKARVSEWRVVDGFVEDELARAARYADLVVVGQADPEALVMGVPSDLGEHVALNTERPVLVVPYVGVATPPGKKVLLCWNGSREASRAATAALPVLAAAAKVVVLSVGGKNGKGANDHVEDIARWLSRHGVKATIKRDSVADTDVASVILSRAADFDADLIVMGVYGHSRMRELVLGGVSRTLLRSMTAPLLIAH
jgi:nucleotide-binding universal stress UspA family protein